jgi:ribokinase
VKSPRVIVFGSINMDLVVRTPRLPVAGETLHGHDFSITAGGKGANQAVAVARLGIPTQMVGRVGNDNFGNALLTSLHAAEVKTDQLLVDTVSSGVAVIAVDDAGENNIIIVAGANGQVNESDVARLCTLLPNAAALLLQLEIPLAAVMAAAQAAQQAGVPAILDPAPAQDIPAALYPLIDILTPNEVEASQLVGFAVNSPETAQRAAAELQRRGACTVIVKLGAKGVVCATTVETFFVPAFAVEAIDTVAAGDAFNGALAAALAEGRSLREAVLWGAGAGALSATKAGAQPSLPERETLEAFLVRNDGKQ